MITGRLDRKIEIQESTPVQDSTGHPVDVWTKFATLRAARRDIRGNERFAAQQTFAVRTATFRMRWIDGIHEKMRLVDKGTIWDIIGIASARQFGWIELTCESKNPSAVD